MQQVTDEVGYLEWYFPNEKKRNLRDGRKASYTQCKGKATGDYKQPKFFQVIGSFRKASDITSTWLAYKEIRSKANRRFMLDEEAATTTFKSEKTQTFGRLVLQSSGLSDSKYSNWAHKQAQLPKW